ncbi:MAG: hypothetical protein IJ325_00605 [Clostridia bacterium]|nr:hypothetical protein [Clostridia bacterium]
MEFQYFGTAAAEGIPAVWCQCAICQRSRKIGGRALRTRSQARINKDLLIDFPGDTYGHILTYGIDMADVHHCLITHTHFDHLYPEGLCTLKTGIAHMEEGYHITFYGSDKVCEALYPFIKGKLDDAGNGRCDVREVKAFETFGVGDYTVTALPAIHGPDSGPLFYQISDGAKNVLYAHDTHYFSEEVWDLWQETKPYFDLVSLDCTNACLPVTYVGHMGLPENIQVKERMLVEGMADENTIFVCNHFSHNGGHVVYDDFVPRAAEKGFLTSYDGMTIEI